MRRCIDPLASSSRRDRSIASSHSGYTPVEYINYLAWPFDTSIALQQQKQLRDASHMTPTSPRSCSPDRIRRWLKMILRANHPPTYLRKSGGGKVYIAAAIAFAAATSSSNTIKAAGTATILVRVASLRAARQREKRSHPSSLWTLTKSFTFVLQELIWLGIFCFLSKISGRSIGATKLRATREEVGPFGMRRRPNLCQTRGCKLKFFYDISNKLNMVAFVEGSRLLPLSLHPGELARDSYAPATNLEMYCSIEEFCKQLLAQYSTDGR